MAAANIEEAYHLLQDQKNYYEYRMQARNEFIHFQFTDE